MPDDATSHTGGREARDGAAVAVAVADAVPLAVLVPLVVPVLQ
jgi:hypothetical protein